MGGKAEKQCNEMKKQQPRDEILNEMARKEKKVEEEDVK